MLLVAALLRCVLLFYVAGQGDVPGSLVDRRDPPRYGFGGHVWPFAASRYVFWDPLVSWLPGPPSVFLDVFRVDVLLVGRLCQQDGEVGFLFEVRSGDASYLWEVKD